MVVLRAAIDSLPVGRADTADLIMHSNRPLARLKLRKAELLLTPGKYSGDVRRAASLEIQFGLQAIERIRQGKVAYAGETGGFDWPYNSAGLSFDGAKRLGQWPTYYEYGMDSDTDGSPQPFLVEVPPNYSSEKKWPLLVYLHGYDGSVDMISKWDTTRALARDAHELGYLVVAPHGRSETDFLNMGEADVLQAVREVRHYYNIDDDRIYLIGGSMGGYGALNLAFHYPYLWAAVAAFTASTDMMVFGGLQRRELIGFRRWHYMWNNPIDLAGNAPHLPVTATYGKADRSIPPAFGEALAEKRSAAGGKYEFSALEGGGHGVGNSGPAYRQALEWFRGKRRNRWPRLVRHKTFTLRYDRSFWVRILGITQWGEPAEIQVVVKNEQIDVTTENVTAFELTLHPLLFDREKPIRIVTNGKAIDLEDMGKPIRIDVVLEPESLLRKTRTLCGPFEDIFNYPFLTVQGTGAKTAARRRESQAQAKWFRKRWEACTDGWPRIKKDVDVTEADLRDYGLLLLGRPAENSVTARIADRLPIRFDDDAFLIDGKRYEGRDVGLAMIHPNPLNPDRYVAIFAGAYYGQTLPVNHPFDSIPDYIIFESRPAATPAEGSSGVFGEPDRHLAAGFFNSQWQVDKNASWVRK